MGLIKSLSGWLAAQGEKFIDEVGPILDRDVADALGPGLADEPGAYSVRDRVARREQVILLVNRRGFSTVLMCAKCGWVDRCPACGVAKIRHEDGSGSFVLRCHHCTRQGPVPPSCPQCANAGLRAIGMGTQKVVSELKRLAAEARVLRMDRDTLSQREADRRIYERFLGGEADILVGTKLVANEFVAYVKLTTEYRTTLDPRSYTLATYALTGFANFGSIGILLGGIGGMAPTRRADLARLGLRALLAGFLAALQDAGDPQAALATALKVAAARAWGWTEIKPWLQADSEIEVSIKSC